jgi:hypothetical protein
MPLLTRRAAAANIEKAKRDLPSQRADAWSQQPTRATPVELPMERSGSDSVEPPIGPSAHSSDDSNEVDEAIGSVSPNAKSSIHVSGLSISHYLRPYSSFLCHFSNKL